MGLKVPIHVRKKWNTLPMIGSLVLESVPGCIVEIGAGWTTSLLYELAVKYNRKFYSCDIKKSPKAIKKRRDFDDRYIGFLGSSFDFEKQFKDKPAFVFLDGCHIYETVRQDFWRFYQRLRPRGVITFHDSMPINQHLAGPGQCQDSYKLRRELERRPDIEIVSWAYPNPYGISMVMKQNPKRWRAPECELLHWDLQE